MFGEQLSDRVVTPPLSTEPDTGGEMKNHTLSPPKTDGITTPEQASGKSVFSILKVIIKQYQIENSHPNLHF